jgi:anion-transporting  ArsA/GET3 family ATPase
MIQLQPETKTLICIGSGGVGKTTMAAAIAVGQAWAGKKVLVLTIDPSRRLAQTMGIQPDGELHRVHLPESAAPGELWSCVIDHKKTFEWFIRTAAQQADVDKILNNTLYQQLSGRLSGSQEFTSLISLQRHVSSGEFDLVILDTPPSQHTWNFLRAPEKIAALFNEGVASWFRQDVSEQGLMKRLLNMGTTQVLKALETLTGSVFMKELSAFFKAIQQWQKPLEDYVNNCHRLLISPQTEFILITALDSSRINEAHKLSREIQKQGYRLTQMIINRIPIWTTEQRSYTSVRLNELKKYYESLEAELYNRLHHFKNSLRVYKCPELRQNSDDVEILQTTYNEISSLVAPGPVDRRSL